MSFVESNECFGARQVVQIGEGVAGAVGHVQVVAQRVTVPEAATDVGLNVLGLADRRGRRKKDKHGDGRRSKVIIPTGHVLPSVGVGVQSAHVRRDQVSLDLSHDSVTFGQ